MLPHPLSLSYKGEGIITLTLRGENKVEVLRQIKEVRVGVARTSRRTRLCAPRRERPLVWESPPDNNRDSMRLLRRPKGLLAITLDVIC